MGERAVSCLASRSPRRQELLRQVGVNFELVDVDVDECRLLHEPGYEYVSRLAVNKAEAGTGGLNSP